MIFDVLEKYGARTALLSWNGSPPRDFKGLVQREDRAAGFMNEDFGYHMEGKHLNDIAEWPGAGNEIAKWIISSDRNDLAEFLCHRGYFMVDRTIRATIPLKKGMDFSRNCRIPVEPMDRPTKRIREIAGQAFLWDSRFFLKAFPAVESVRKQIQGYVDGMGALYVCRHKGEIMGFLEAVKDEASPARQAFIRLAAVDNAYRAAGAALSLYAGVAAKCREQGMERLWGRISSRNMAVMNIYASLGASFSLPQDVYARR